MGGVINNSTSGTWQNTLQFDLLLETITYKFNVILLNFVYFLGVAS